jgi:hypothetical protein
VAKAKGINRSQKVIGGKKKGKTPIIRRSPYKIKIRVSLKSQEVVEKETPLISHQRDRAA